MEPLNIPHLADETLIGGSFQTPILEDVTYGQRDNSRLFHTREDDSLPFHYYPRNTRKKKILASCSNDKFAGCKAKFSLISKDPQNTVKVERPGKKLYLGKFNQKVKRNQINARRPKTVHRQEKLEEIYEIYKNLSLDEQVSQAVSTAYQIGTLNKIQVQFSFFENPDQTNLPSDSDSD